MESKAPFTNAQLELLKLFSTNLSEKDLLELKTFLGRFYAQKAIGMADKIWEERGFTQTNMDEWLHEKS
ncbi:MAG: hypothetical protein ABR502_11340 [Chitinophagaceae bacterium]